MPETYIHKDGEKNYYISEWKGEKGPIICTHGLTANYASFIALAEELSPKFRVIAYDLRGRGKSSRTDEDTSIYKHGEDLISLIDSLELNNPFLVGHSMGAYVALSAATKTDRIKGLVLLDGGVDTPDKMMDNMIIPLTSKLEETYSSIEKYINQTKKFYTNLDMKFNKYTEKSLKHGVKEKEDGTIISESDPDRVLDDAWTVAEFDPEKHCPNIKCPTLYVRSTETVMGSTLFKEETVRESVDLTPDAEYFEIEANHFTMVFQKQPKLAEKIDEFFNNVK